MRAGLAIVLVTALAGCGGSPRPRGGGATGAAGGADAGTTGGVTVTQAGPCVETTSLIAASQTTTLGFSANDVLAATGGVRSTDLAWMDEKLYATHSRALTKTSLTLNFAQTPTAVRFVDSAGGGCPDRGRDGYGTGEPCVSCSDRMEIDIALSMSTGDGALNEQLTMTLVTMSRRGPRFKVDLAAEAVVGSYFTGIVPNAGYSLVGVHIEAAFGMPFAGSRSHVASEWNGFAAAQVVQGKSTRPIMQAHGYFPRQTAGAP